MCCSWTSPPLSLGIETLGGVMTKLIEKNTTIPVRKSEVFSTADDNQPAVTVHVLQGEREMAADNRQLGRFELTGIAPAPRGVPQIEVCFDIDANGIVNVSATDKATGKAHSIQITSSSGLSKEEVENLIKDAKQNEARDRMKKEAVQARNEADAMIYEAEKLVKSDGVDAAAAGRVSDTIRNLKQAMEKEDTEQVKALTRDLGHAVQALNPAMQAAQGNPAGQNAGGAGAPHQKASSPDDDDVVDAEFSEVA